MNILLKTQNLRHFTKYKCGSRAVCRAIIDESRRSAVGKCTYSSMTSSVGRTIFHRGIGTTTSISKIQNSVALGRMNREIWALTNISRKSGFLHPDKLHHLCASVQNFSTSSAHNQQQSDRDRDSGREQDDEEKEEGNSNNRVPGTALTMLLFWTAFVVYITLRALNNEENGIVQFTSWNEFYHDMLAKGEVREIVIHPEGERAEIWLQPGAVIKGQKVQNRVYQLKIADPYKFEGKIQKAEEELGIRGENGIPISYRRTNAWMADLFAVTVICVLLYAVFRNFSKIKTDALNPANMFASARKANFVRADLQKSHNGKSLSFKDVAGLHEAKVEIMEFVDYIRHPERFTTLGAKVPKGALLLGPPGCGKTLLAKALSAEAKVPFLVMAGSEFVEMIGGLGAARVRNLFKEAGEKAPCIIYIDEIDAIGRKRSGNNWSESSEEEHTLNQLLVEMDGMSSKKGVILIASTNRADVLDKALLRPGRFDRHIMIDYPTLSERKEMFDMYLRQLKVAMLPDNYPDRLAQLTPGMTGADIANVCNEAALHAARLTKLQVGTEDFEYAVERLIAGVEKKSKMLSGHEKKVVAYHEAGHALVGWLLEHPDPLLRVSIVPRTSNALGFAQYLPSDKKLHSKEELFERICMALGGRVAESLTFNSVTSGAQNDLQQVTRNAYAQIRELGMNERIGLVSFPSDPNQENTRPYSKYLTHLIDEEAKNLVAHAYQMTEKLLSENKEKLRVIAEELLEKEALTYREVEQLIGPPSFVKPDIPDINKPS